LRAFSICSGSFTSSRTRWPPCLTSAQAFTMAGWFFGKLPNRPGEKKYNLQAAK
jgi:hypothetical protein